MKRSIKPIIFCLFTIVILSFFTSCVYNPPEGYTKKHHTRDEILKFALSIDPNATVSQTYTDTKIDAWNRNFREWDAVINGIECHVSSVGDMVWDSTGEFPKQYYVIDTDYDYFLLQKTVSEKQSDWKIKYTDIGARYNNYLFVETSYMEKRELSTDELEIVWSQTYEIYKEYNSYPVRKTASFSVVAPAVYSNGNGENKHIKITSESISDFSAEGKAKFFEEYAEAWDLLGSGLPIEE